jgi:hypothetical protein
VKKENAYQAGLIRKLQKEFKGCIVVKNDPNYIQGIPDLLVLYNDKWAALEVKRSSNARHRPNQDYYVDKMNNMSYATFIYPENEESVFNSLRRLFNEVQRPQKLSRKSRVPKCEQLPLAK